MTFNFQLNPSFMMEVTCKAPIVLWQNKPLFSTQIMKDTQVNPAKRNLNRPKALQIVFKGLSTHHIGRKHHKKRPFNSNQIRIEHMLMLSKIMKRQIIPRTNSWIKESHQVGLQIPFGKLAPFLYFWILSKMKSTNAIDWHCSQRMAQWLCFESRLLRRGANNYGMLNGECFCW